MKDSAFLRTILAIAMALTAPAAWSQGCSDAGFCTMGAMRPDQKFHRQAAVKLRAVEVSHYYGHNRFGDQFFAYTLDAHVAIGERSQAQFKIPYMRVKGLIMDTQGWSDISLSFSRVLLHRERWQLQGTVGAKIPTGRPDKQWQGRDLPMYYQTTLGTFDAVAGLSLLSRKWLLATGIQQALTNTGNDFLLEDWEGTRWVSEAGGYPPSSGQLRRGTDVMMRVERNFRAAKFNMAFGVLSIFRLTRDVVDHPSGFRASPRGKLERTSGPAITALGSFGYHIGPKSSVKVTVGRRLVKRHFTPDGLSREFVNTVGYEWRF